MIPSYCPNGQNGQRCDLRCPASQKRCPRPPDADCPTRLSHSAPGLTSTNASAGTLWAASVPPLTLWIMGRGTGVLSHEARKARSARPVPLSPLTGERPVGHAPTKEAA